MDVVGHQEAPAAEAAQVDDVRAGSFDDPIRLLHLRAGTRTTQVERDRDA